MSPIPFRRKPLARLPVVLSLALVVLTGGLQAQSEGYLAFDGADDRATGPGGGLFDLPGNYTLEAWVNPTTINGEDSICGRGNGFSGSFNYMFQLHNGRPRLWHAGGFPWFEANSTVPAGEWNHVAIVVTPTTYQFYLNGQPDGNGTHNRTLSTSSMPFTIGRQGSDFVNNLWHGRLDDLRVWSVARTQSEIQNGMRGCGVPATGLVARYEFDCISGQTLLDTSGNGLDAVLGTTASVESTDPMPSPPAPLGEALGFDGSDDRATGPGGGLFNLPGNYTLEAWVNPTTINGEDSICGRGNGFSGSFNYMFQLHNGRPRLWHAGGFPWFEAGSTVPAGEWNHVAIVVTPTTYQFYLNGQPDGNGTHNRTLSTSSMPFMIGRQGSDFVNNLWHGRLDELRVWNVARTQQQIADSMWDLANPSAEANLVACYDMDGRSQTVFDSSAHAYHAVLGSSASTESIDPARTGDGFFDPHIGAAQGAIDDTVHSLALGFSFAFPDGTPTSTVDVDSNGVIQIPAGVSDYAPTTTKLLDNASALYPFWVDMTLDGIADDIYFQALPDVALITWECARYYNQDGLFRIQAQLYPDGSARFVYPDGVPPSSPIIGVSEGGGVADPGQTDLSSILATTPLTGGGATIYEQVPFDLQNPAGPDAMVLFSPNGSGYDVSTNLPIVALAAKHGQACRRSIRFVPDGSGVYTASDVFDAYDPDYGSALAITGDDQVGGPFALGFSFTFPGGTVTDMVDLDSNCRILPPGTDGSDGDPDIASFLTEAHPTIAPFWCDLNLAGPVGGMVFQKIGPGFSRFTWDSVSQFLGEEPITVQATLFDDDSITVTLVGTALFVEGIGYFGGVSRALIGVSDGSLGSTPAEQDFSSLPVTVSGAVYEFWDGVEDLDLQLTLETLTVPALGSAWNMRLDGLPASTFAVAVIMGLGNPALDLTGTGIGLDGCYLLTTGDLGSLPAGINGSQSTIVTINFGAGDTGLVGLTLFMQGAVLAPGTTPLGAALANGVQATIGY